MNMTQYFVKNTTVSWLLTLVVVVSGVLSFNELGRYEDPEFTIKNAVIITQYPGATAEEVHEEISEKVEAAMQQLKQLKEVTSQSQQGLSIVTVEMKDQYNAKTLPQVWDELRRKVAAIQLPSGAGPIMVNDDFGDVYGLFYAVTGEGFSQVELRDIADDVRKEILRVDGVAKVGLWGEPKEQIFVDLSVEQMGNNQVSPNAVAQAISPRSAVVSAGTLLLGDKRVMISPKSETNSVQAIKNSPISSASGVLNVEDIANVHRGVSEQPTELMTYDAQIAIGFGISNLPGENVVELGKRVATRLTELESTIPAGVAFHKVSNQADIVDTAISDFLISLVQALVIVVVTLLIFMGIRSGLLIGSILVLTVSGTFVAMLFYGIDLQRISLGALVIALGMMVDNAIVVTEGILVRTEKGMKTIDAIIETVSKTQWPLLGGTVIGFVSFAAIGLSPDSVGEFAGSLFWVVLFSLSLSWVFAITLTPFFANYVFKGQKKTAAKSEDDVYKGFMFIGYKRVLQFGLKNRVITLVGMFALLVFSLANFGSVGKSFFPASNKAQFIADVWFEQGADILETQRKLQNTISDVRALAGVTHVSSFVGAGALRFQLTYEAEQTNSSYGQLIIDVEHLELIDQLIPQVQSALEAKLPEALIKVWRFQLGPGGGSKIEARFTGPDPVVLRELAEQAKAIMAEHPNASAIKDDWRAPVKVIEPVISDLSASRMQLTPQDIKQMYALQYGGTQIGAYRESDKLIPIVMRMGGDANQTSSSIDQVQGWSNAAGQVINARQVINDVEFGWTAPLIRSVDRQLAIKAMCDPKIGLASDLQADLTAPIEAIELPVGYALEWKGEIGNSGDAQSNLMGNFPMQLLVMFFIIVLLFNSMKQPLIIFLTIPLIFIGVTWGLLAVSGSNFDFMALLGVLSLIGMLIKNAIVLLDEMDLNLAADMEGTTAVFSAAMSRLRPVMMGTLTTVLGMIPLLSDPFYMNMAIVIMAGLTFGTLLTMVVVPILYTYFFRITPSVSKLS